MSIKERQSCRGNASKWKEKAVIRFCPTRKDVLGRVPLAIFCVYDLEERGSGECGARERNPVKPRCETEAEVWGHRARAAALVHRPGGSEEGLRPRLGPKTFQPGSSEVRSQGGLQSREEGAGWFRLCLN